ncbi:ABC transporter substrate-binding protein [Chelativorans sp. J32]|uniref:ABC transporter substrate-binding protein n=1 Tax=Chelativorans sp. J32 TaxID=935840 RepID=UPI000488F8FF|nr:ABC transporter substrate-binding protein [Chelativorans sp. J32]
MRNKLLVAAVAGLIAVAIPGGGAPALAAEDTVTVASLPLLTFDPAFARTVQDLSIMSQVYSSLTTASFVDGNLTGNLAREWSDVDGKEFTFKLVPGAKFANGEPLDAHAVVWNFKRLMDPATQATVITDFNLITSVEAPDAETVIIKTSTPWLELPRRLSAISFIAPEWAKTHNPKVEVNPSGPYTVVDYDFASHVTLKRNENYFGEKPAFENAIYRVIGNNQTRVTSLRSGELNFANGISPLDVEQLSSLEDLKVGAIPGRRVHVLRFNMLRDNVKDVRVRQALNYAINKELITKTIYRGQTSPASTQALIPGQVGFDETMTPWPYDPDKARQLLAEERISVLWRRASLRLTSPTT